MRIGSLEVKNLFFKSFFENEWAHGYNDHDNSPDGFGLGSVFESSSVLFLDFLENELLKALE